MAKVNSNQELKDLLRDVLREEGVATKADVRQILKEESVVTRKDFSELKEYIGVVVEEKAEKILEEKLSYLPIKEDFYNYMDKLMGEVQTSRDEQTILGHQVSTLADRVDALEN